MFNLSNADKELLMHKLYKTLTVLPLSSLLTEDNFKDLVKTTDGSILVNSMLETVDDKTLEDMCDNFYPLNFTPILVNKCVDDSYYVVDGWDRLLAADSMGWTTIPCFVIQIPCGDDFILNNDDGSWECNGGLRSYGHINIALHVAGYDLLKVLK